MEPVVVVVPFYKEKMTTAERVSLQQLYRVLGRYPIVFMIPEKLRGSSFLHDKVIEAFPDECLSSRRGYSELLLTPQFYRRFQQYEYLLIYQLDAFVFSDRLLYFCSLGCDYIGAPMPAFWINSVRSKVGNGGFSLRKISSCIQVTEIRRQIYQKTGKQELFEEAEDKFFGYCVLDEMIPFSAPSVKIAADFSIEFDTSHDLKNIKRGILPFGCHGWSKPHNFSFWRPYLEKFLVPTDLDDIEREVSKQKNIDFHEFQEKTAYRILIRRYIQQSKKGENILCKEKPYILWGYGLIGRRIERLLYHLQCDVAYIYDKKERTSSKFFHISLSCPEDEILSSKKYKIIISTSNYEKEIAEKLEELGLHRHEDYLLYKDIVQILVAKHYIPAWKRYKQST